MKATGTLGQIPSGVGVITPRAFESFRRAAEQDVARGLAAATDQVAERTRAVETSAERSAASACA